MEICNFEIAKKLKEKGFNELCYKYYQKGVLDSDDCWNRYNKGTADRCSAPTISQVLKWLFDEKQLFVNIDCNICDKFGLFFTIYKKGEETWEACGFDDNYYNKPEEATLAAIEYVLDNLI